MVKANELDAERVASRTKGPTMGFGVRAVLQLYFLGLGGSKMVFSGGEYS